MALFVGAGRSVEPTTRAGQQGPGKGKTDEGDGGATSGIRFRQSLRF